jgi:hypothetical protein
MKRNLELMNIIWMVFLGIDIAIIMFTPHWILGAVLAMTAVFCIYQNRKRLNKLNN